MACRERRHRAADPGLHKLNKRSSQQGKCPDVAARPRERAHSRPLPRVFPRFNQSRIQALDPAIQRWRGSGKAAAARGKGGACQGSVGLFAALFCCFVSGSVGQSVGRLCSARSRSSDGTGKLWNRGEGNARHNPFLLRGPTVAVPGVHPTWVTGWDGGMVEGQTSIGPRCPANVAAAQSAARRRSEDCAECQRYEQDASHLSLAIPRLLGHPRPSPSVCCGWLFFSGVGPRAPTPRHAITACRSRSGGLSCMDEAGVLLWSVRSEAGRDSRSRVICLCCCWPNGGTWRACTAPGAALRPLLGASIGAWSPARIPGIPCIPCPLLPSLETKRLPEIEAAPPTTPLNAELEELGASHRLHLSATTTHSHVPDGFLGFRSGPGLNAGTGATALVPLFVRFWLRACPVGRTLGQDVMVWFACTCSCRWRLLAGFESSMEVLQGVCGAAQALQHACCCGM